MAKKYHKHKISTEKQFSTGDTVPISSLKVLKPELKLIRLDNYARLYIIACLTLFLFFVGLKWHNSSIPWWNQVARDGGNFNRGLIEGKALGVRSDEWMVSSSFILAQQKKGFPVANEALGFGKTPLANKLPTKHIVSIIKPAFWGYYFLDLERAFAWHWNFKIFPFLISSFLLLMLFTKNNLGISIFGSIWLFLSSAIQWWSMNTELFTWGCLSVISFIYILSSGKRTTIIAHGVLFVISSWSFIMVLYPAYQVPLAFFLLALVLGYMIKYKNSLRFIITSRLKVKILTMSISLAALLFLVFLFYRETKDTLDVIANTVYPGRRNERGGDFSFLRMFADNFSLFMNQETFPSKWKNICEASSFLMLTPVASIMIVIDLVKTKKWDPIFISILMYQFIMVFWFFIGFPEVLAALTLFKTSPPIRSFFIFGFSNVIITLLFLSHYRTPIIRNNIVTGIATFILLFILSYGINYFLNQQADFFFSSMQVGKATIIFACLNWLVIYFNDNSIYQKAFFMICLLFIGPNIKINPLSHGLSPYFENAIYQSVTGINAKEPHSGWVVFGQHEIADYLKAAGINCFNGVQFAPPLKKLHVLDPLLKNESVYNRYAHISLTSLIGGKDSIKFILVQDDLYSIRMDPCSPRLKQLGIDYFLFTYPPDPIEVRCMTLVKKLGFPIYRRN